jgi:hypothetical protein
MSIKRTIVLALSSTIGVLALAHPASASGPTFVEAWPQKYTVVADTGAGVDGDADVDGRDFLVWQRHLG